MCLLSGVLYIILYYVWSIIQKIAIGRVLLSLFIPVCLGVVVLAFVAVDLSPLRMHRAIKNGGALYVCWQDLLSFVILFFVFRKRLNN